MPHHKCNLLGIGVRGNLLLLLVVVEAFYDSLGSLDLQVPGAFRSLNGCIRNHLKREIVVFGYTHGYGPHIDLISH